MKKLILLLMLLCSFGAHATTTYFCDTTGVGADAAGAGFSGADANAGTLASAPKKTVAAWNTVWAAAVPGDKLLMCKGGAWDAWSNGNAAPANTTLAAYQANPVVVDSYSSPQFVSTAQPRLNTVINKGALTVTAIAKSHDLGACASQAAMLAETTAVVADYCTRTDIGASAFYQLTAAAYGTLANWSSVVQPMLRVTVANTLATYDMIEFTTTTGIPDLVGRMGQVQPTPQAPTSSVVWLDIDSTTWTSSGTAWTAFKSCGYNDPSGACVAFNFYGGTGYLSAANYGGYTIQNLHVYGGDGYGTLGAMIQSAPVSVVFNNMTFDHLDGAFECNAGASLTPSMNVLRGSTLSYLLGNGLMSWGCDNTLIENNTFDHTANRPTSLGNKYRDHPMYVSGSQQDVTVVPVAPNGITIRGNTITNSGLNVLPDRGFPTADGTQCQTNRIAGHGYSTGYTIENNKITQAAGTNGGSCYGFGVSPDGNGGANHPEYEKLMVVRGNLVVNPGNQGFSTAACQNCLIENNVIVWEQAYNGATGISVIQGQFNGATPVTNNANVRLLNNSVYMYGATGAQSYGLSLGGIGSGHVIANNLVYYGAGGTVGLGTCINLPIASANYAAWNNNLCYGGGVWATGYTGASLAASLTAFTTGTGFDAQGLTSNPNITIPAVGNGYSMSIGAGSPAIGAGNTTYKASRDFTTCARPTSPAIGAYEYFAVACGTKPAASGTQLH